MVVFNSPQPVPNRDELFPLVQPKVYDAHTLELALVLGGTVSAGAYTAGALDYLVQALNAWHLPVGGAAPQSAGRHSVKLRIATGASGGAVCAAMLGIAAPRDVAPISISNPPEQGMITNNPFWDVWVEGLDIKGFTSTVDLDKPNATLYSILCPASLDSASGTLVDIATKMPAKVRPYLEDPYRLVVTLANLRGVPYLLATDGWNASPGSCVVQHDDFMRLALPINADPSGGFPWKGKRPDELWVDPNHAGEPGYIDWDEFAKFPRASGAFPIGLKAQLLDRPVSHYLYRPYVDFVETTAPPPATGGTAVIREARLKYLTPVWDWIIGKNAADVPYEFTTVDGGTFNNDPISLARTWLSGLATHNVRDSKLADRVVLMIDPLASTEDNDRTQNVKDDLLGIIGPLIQGIIQGGRYLTADLMLMADPDVFSRFQLVPTEPGRNNVGDLSIIGGALGAFGGFFSRDYRVHDFMLGRVNMQAYLRSQFVLHRDNALFTHWSDDDRRRWAVTLSGQRQKDITSDDCYLPIVPDVTMTAGAPDVNDGVPWGQVPWPKSALDVATATGLLKHRLERVIEQAQAEGIPGLLGWLGAKALEGTIAGTIANAMVSKLQGDLKTRGVPVPESVSV